MSFTSTRLIMCCLLVLLLLFDFSGKAHIRVEADTPPVWKLVWQDEFNGPDGAPVDISKWTPEVGGSGWGNHELEYYTNRTDNAFQSDGSLVIKVIKEHYTGSDNVTREYTSA